MLSHALHFEISSQARQLYLKPKIKKTVQLMEIHTCTIAMLARRTHKIAHWKLHSVMIHWPDFFLLHFQSSSHIYVYFAAVVDYRHFLKHLQWYLRKMRYRRTEGASVALNTNDVPNKLSHRQNKKTTSEERESKKNREKRRKRNVCTQRSA